MFIALVQNNDSGVRENGGLEKPVLKRSYIIGLLVIFASIYSQYALKGLSPILAAFVIYGIPILTTIILWGSSITRRAFNHTYTALKFGLGLFGAFTVLGMLVAAAILFIIVTLDPSAANLLQRPNPALDIPPKLAWVMVWISLFVVGPFEEYLFRGFVYGGLLSILKDRHWLSLAFVSSILFATAHPYYAFVYGITSLVQFTDLVAFGMAMAATYHLSGGNLLIPAMIHGTYDASEFFDVATSSNLGASFRGYMIMASILVAIVLFIQKMPITRVIAFLKPATRRKTEEVKQNALAGVK